MKSPTARGAGSALTWKAIEMIGTKAVFLLRVVVLARLLTPDDFGLLAIAMVAIGVSNRLTDLGMVPALIQTEKADDALYDVAWSVGLVRALVIGGVIYVAASPIAVLFSDPRAADLIRLLALQPLLEALVSIRMVDFIRNLEFRSVTFIRLPAAICNTIVAIALAPSLGVWALVAGALAGPAATLIASYILAPHRPRISFDSKAATSLIRFGRWIFLAGVAALFANVVLRFVISRQLTTADLGLYYLAASLAFTPSELMSSLVGNVTFPMYSRLQDAESTLGRAFRSVLAGTSTLLIPACLLLIVLSPGLVQFVLGDKWQGTVPVIQILGTVNLVGLLGENVTPILKGVGRPNRVVAIEVTQSIVLISLVWIFTSTWGLSGAALAWIPAIAVSQFMSGAFVKDILPHPFRGLGKTLVSIIGVSLIASAAAVLIFRAIPSLPGLLLALIVSVIIAAASLMILDRTLKLGLGEDVKRVFPQIAMLPSFVRSKEQDGEKRETP